MLIGVHHGLCKLSAYQTQTPDVNEVMIVVCGSSQMNESNHHRNKHRLVPKTRTSTIITLLHRVTVFWSGAACNLIQFIISWSAASRFPEGVLPCERSACVSAIPRVLARANWTRINESTKNVPLVTVSTPKRFSIAHFSSFTEKSDLVHKRRRFFPPIWIFVLRTRVN